jgi:hypothetical protein
VAVDLVDKGEDESERDDVVRSRSRTRRMALIGGVVALVAAGSVGAWALFSGNDEQGSASDDSAEESRLPSSGSTSAEADDTELRFAPSAAGDWKVQWVELTENGNGGFEGDPNSTTQVWIEPGASLDQGTWLQVRVQLLDRFERRSFNPANYIDMSRAKEVRVGDYEGVYVGDDFDGSSSLMYGPVLEGYAITLTGNDIPEAQFQQLAAELELAERSDLALADARLGPVFESMEMTLVGEFESYGYYGTGFSSPLDSFSSRAFNVSYSDGVDGYIGLTVRSSANTEQYASLAAFVLSDVQEVTVQGHAGIAGTAPIERGGGSAVYWSDGDRLFQMAGQAEVDELLALAESVEQLTDADVEEMREEAMAGQQGMTQEESWIIDAGDDDDGVTWIIEGVLDDDGQLLICPSVMSNTGASTSDCSTDLELPADPALLEGPEVGWNATTPSAIAAAPADQPGYILRFTPVGEAPIDRVLHPVTEIDQLLAAQVIYVPGTVELIAPDGTVVDSTTFDEDDVSDDLGPTETIAIGG